MIVPFVDRVHQDLGLEDDQPALAVFDHFKSQMTEQVTQQLEENDIHSVIIPRVHNIVGGECLTNTA